MWCKIVALTLLTLPMVFVAQAQTPPGVQVQSLQLVGSGCPAGSHSATISPDGQTFSVLLDNFTAASTMQNTLQRVNCQIKANLSVPSGWTFAVISAEYRGFAYAESGTVATHQALYSFDGSQPRNERPGFENGGTFSFRAQEFRGPYNDNYYIRHEVDPRVAPWAPCGNQNLQSLYITTYLMAQNLNRSSLVQAQISLDSLDGQLQSQRYQFAWRQCTPSSGIAQPPARPYPQVPEPGRPPRYPGPGRR